MASPLVLEPMIECVCYCVLLCVTLHLSLVSYTHRVARNARLDEGEVTCRAPLENSIFLHESTFSYLEKNGYIA